MNIELRTTIPNASDYYLLYQTTGWNNSGLWTKEMLHTAIQNSWHIVTGYEGEKLIASGRLVSDGIMQCFVCDMIIHPDYQHQGIGTLLMQELIHFCKDNHIRWIQLSCAQGKKAFYQRFGFHERASDAPGMNLFL